MSDEQMDHHLLDDVHARSLDVDVRQVTYKLDLH